MDMWTKLLIFCTISFLINFGFNEHLRLTIQKLREENKRIKAEHAEDARTFIETVNMLRGDL